MAESENMLVNKICELVLEMRTTGLWQVEEPERMNNLEKKVLHNGNDFAQWLKYVFIPNQLQHTGQFATLNGRQMTSPAAVKIFANDMQKRKLLQILIEIDSLL